MLSPSLIAKWFCRHIHDFLFDQALPQTLEYLPASLSSLKSNLKRSKSGHVSRHKKLDSQGKPNMVI
jgi:hypothetical protein